MASRDLSTDACALRTASSLTTGISLSGTPSGSIVAGFTSETTLTDSKVSSLIGVIGALGGTGAGAAFRGTRGLGTSSGGTAAGGVAGSATAASLSADKEEGTPIAISGAGNVGFSEPSKALATAVVAAMDDRGVDAGLFEIGGGTVSDEIRAFVSSPSSCSPCFSSFNCSRNKLASKVVLVRNGTSLGMP